MKMAFAFLACIAASSPMPACGAQRAIRLAPVPRLGTSPESPTALAVKRWERTGVVVLFEGTDPNVRSDVWVATPDDLPSREQAVLMLSDGGRLVILLEGMDREVEEANRLLKALGIGITGTRFRALTQEPLVVERDQATGGLQSVSFVRPLKLECRGTARPLVRTSAGEIVMAVDRSPLTTCGRPGCDVVVIGDSEWLLENCLTPTDEPARERARTWTILLDALVDPHGEMVDPAEGGAARCRRSSADPIEVERCLGALASRQDGPQRRIEGGGSLGR